MSQTEYFSPKTHHSTSVTSKNLSHLLPQFLKQVGSIYQNRPDLVIAAWPEVIGLELAKMTRVLSFIDGVLIVTVKNATLFSLLSQNDRPRILKNLREKFPQTSIKTIIFRHG